MRYIIRKTRSFFKRLTDGVQKVRVDVAKKYFPYEYAKIYYHIRTGKTLSYKDPRSFNEKLFWLERYWKDPRILQCTDKYLVREYVINAGWASILNPLYGVYTSEEDINFGDLPQKFVLKCTHGCGFTIFCQDKASLDEREVKRILRQWMNTRYGRVSAEFHYEKLIPKIVAENYIEDASGRLIEVQFFCLNGKPEFILARNDLGYSEELKDGIALSYTLDWKRVAYRKREEELMHLEMKKPKLYETMLQCAADLARPFPHVRVDFYDLGEIFIFGELTFSTSGNVLSNYNDQVIDVLGEKLVLPNLKKTFYTQH